MCPGDEDPLALDPDQAGAASMRPGHMCPGDTGYIPLRPTACWRFNEAGAHVPRRHGRSVAGRDLILALQ